MNKKCHLCGKEYRYDEIEDKDTNETLLKKIRQVVVDGDNSFPLFTMPPDKRRLVNPELIKFECSGCLKGRLAE